MRRTDRGAVTERGSARTRLLAAAALAFGLAGGCVAAQDDGSEGEGPCRNISFEGVSHTVCEVRAGEDLRLWLTAPDGRPFGSFGRIAPALGPGESLAFAMNAGMYHADRRPVGLYVEQGEELAPLVTAAGPGNFGLLPNGVFCIRTEAQGFAVVESRAFAAAPPDCRDASQSGPMLVIEGALHPRFLPESDSLNVRNGVGVSPDGVTALFAISNAPVNFHHFARLFRDGLGVRDALYFDGSISRLLAPGLGRADSGRQMGPVVGLVVPAGDG